MRTWQKLGGWVVAVGMLFGACAMGSEDAIPQGSAIAQGPQGWQRLLLNPMEDASSVGIGAWKLKGTYVAPAENVDPRLGRTALTFGAEEAEQAGSKGDFTVRDNVPGEMRTVGLWVHLSEAANVARLGVQLYDAEGEALISLVPADWTGWKWVELDLSGADVEQAYEQPDKNAVPDYPLKSVHVAWFTKAAGATSLTVDAVVGLTRLENVARQAVSIDMSAPEMVQPGTAKSADQRSVLTASLVATNFTKEPAYLTVRHSMQEDPSFYSRPLPDPVFGSDHAAGSKSWLVVDGEIVDEPGSTDGKPWTSATTPWQREHYTEAFQFVDLGQVRKIRKMTWLSGDANHSWFVDVFASDDGETFAAVPGLSGVDHFKKWGWRDFPVEKPFKARVLKFRYRTAGKKEDIIRFPTELGIYDGVADEVVGLPDVGPPVEEGTLLMEVPPHSFAVRLLEFQKPLDAGAYPDGKCPLDFVEVINVHFYSGQEPPETCTTDGNANVTSSTTFAENLRELSQWRDRYAAEMPIWMTETGYDSAGPFGTTEAIQAARLPRVVMLCLANGIDKVFVYRESGSTPSMHACSGVLRNDFSRKPSWYTFGTLIRQLDGVRGGARRLPHTDENVWLMEWDATTSRDTGRTTCPFSRRPSGRRHEVTALTNRPSVMMTARG